MNRETADKIIVYSRNTESGYKIRKALFVNYASIRYVRVTSKIFLCGVQVCRSSVVNK